MSYGAVNYVDNLWLIIGLGAVTIAFQVLIAAAWMVIGGMGGTWRTNKVLAQQTDDIQRIDTRITREVKQRASQAAVEARTEARTGGNLKEEAMKTLAEEKQATTDGRPSVAHLIRR